MDADKFHANCYSYNGTVLSMHLLLRLKPWRMMWGGNYVYGQFEKYSRDEDLHGLSAYLSKEYFEESDDYLKENGCYHQVKLMEKYHKQWKRIHVLDEAIRYFDWKTTKSVKYEGYLLNHTQKTAVDLADFYRQSVSLADDGAKIAIDLVPVLCETGDGAPMAFFDGISTDTTEELAGTWCGDELQIVDDLPENYRLIKCCFAGIWRRAKYCYRAFGVNQEGYLLKDDTGNLYEATRLNIVGKRGDSSIVKIEKTERGIKFIPEPITMIQ